MVFRNVGICLLVLCMPLAVVAQEKVKTVAELAQDVQNLQTQLKATSENLTELAKRVATIAETATKNEEKLNRLSGVVNEEIKQQQSLLERIDELTSLQQEHFTQQQQILDSIAAKDSGGNDVLRLSATMAKSEEFRQDVRKAVNDSLDREGEVVIQNRMQSFQWIKVNQTDYGIPPGDTLTLKVPVGTVTAQLPGQRLTNWTVTAPNYRQKIDIVPDSQATVTTYRPVAPQPLVPLNASPIETYTVDQVLDYTLPPTSWYVWPY